MDLVPSEGGVALQRESQMTAAEEGWRRARKSAKKTVQFRDGQREETGFPKMLKITQMLENPVPFPQTI